MYIKFKSLKFKNILSYGSNVTEVNFNTGLIGITGKNGFGKSTLLDALSFNLFGQPYRKIKINDLVNRHNKGKLVTESIFIINNKEYKLIRSLKPSDVYIEVDGVPPEMLSSKKLIQEDINKILGIDYLLFKQIICLSINYNKPFLSLSSNDKRDIVESIFNIKVFGEMLKLLKKEQAGLKIQQQINKKSLSILENNLSSYRKQLKELETTKNNFEENKRKDLETVNERIKDLKSFIKSNKIELKALDTKKSQINIVEDDSKSLLKDNEKELNILTYKIDELKKSISNLTSIEICPTCYSKVDNEHIKRHSELINKDLDLYQEKMFQFSLEISRLTKIIDEQNSNKNEYQSLESNINSLLYKINHYTDELKRNEDQKTLIENRSFDFNLDSFKEDFENQKNEYSITYKKNKDLSLDIHNNDIISNIISENGIKAHFFKKLLPVLNTKINYYLELFDLPIVIKLNSLLEEEITDITGKFELPYMGFSEGEKKRIDLAILLSLISTTKSISNWNCNLIFFDELFDSAADSDGLEKFVKTLKAMVHKNHDLGIYIISHRLNDEDFFTKKLEIYKTGVYSNMVEK